MRMNVSVKSILTGEIKALILQYHIHSSWFVEPLRYVNCSRRGLVTLPGTIPRNVEFLDLSSNIINQVVEKKLKKFVDLKVLWLHSNGIENDMSETQFCLFCFGWLKALLSLREALGSMRCCCVAHALSRGDEIRHSSHASA